MNLYASRKSVSGGSIVFTVLFFLVFFGAGYLFFIDKGKFWDYLPFICIPSLVLTLILLIVGMILSSIFGPFALINSATEEYSGKNYTQAITNYKKILDTYPSSRYATEALINISDSYYRNGNYPEAIIYYEKSINDKIIDGETLDIKKIFADSYLKIADSYYAAKDYSNAGEYYRKSVNYFEQILQKYPETNDAFIAKYKIPEYLFKAADCLKNKKDWDGSAAILKNIVDKYPESEFSSKSYKALFDIYIAKALDIKETGEYRESVIEFFKIYDLGDDLLGLVQSEIKYSQNNLLEGIPQNFLVQAANDFYKLAEYKKSLIVYDYFLANYPDNEYMIIDNLVNIKIKTISEKPYDPIPEFTAAGSFTKNGNSKITLDNRTEFNLTVYLGGTEYRIARLEKKTKTEVEVIAGAYKIVVEIQNPENGLLYGEASFEDGKKYKDVYTITAEQS
jgi:outer membrane protein assembly factor BamD (BamD/ComL family)